MIWLADIILVIALILLGRRGWHSLGWFFSAGGNALWTVGAIRRGSGLDIITIPIVFTAIACYNYYKTPRGE